MKSIAKPVAVVLLLLTFTVGSVCLHLSLDLSEPSFMSLMIMSAIFSVLLPKFNELKSFFIAKGQLILQEIKVSEAAVKELAIATVDLVESANECSIVTGAFDQERYDQAIAKIKAITQQK